MRKAIKTADITVEMVREVLDYDPVTGLFKRTSSALNGSRAGLPAGTLAANGYIMIRIYTKLCCAHRLGWALHYGEFPRFFIDHINGNPSDNRIENLRDVPQKANCFNKGKNRKLLGATQFGDRWKYAVLEWGKITYEGDFPTADEANKAFLSRQNGIENPYQRRPKVRIYR